MNEGFELPDGSCYVPQIQDYFEYSIKKKKKHLLICIYKIEDKITLKSKNEHYFEL